MAARSPTFEITTRLAAPAAEVWDEAVTPEGINYEFEPFLRMTMPGGLPSGATLDDVEPGEPLGRSWLLAGRLLPVEFDNLKIEEVGPGLRFRERSTMGTARTWEHEREVVAIGDETCELSDRLTVEVRTPLRLVGGGIIAPRIVAAIFKHRHRRLASRWGLAEERG